MQRFDVAGHEPSFLPEGEWKLVFSDEFDGTELDRTKWDFRYNFWGKPFGAYTDAGVVLDGNSHIELHRTEKDGYYVSPQPTPLIFPKPARKTPGAMTSGRLAS